MKENTSEREALLGKKLTCQTAAKKDKVKEGGICMFSFLDLVLYYR